MLCVGAILLSKPKNPTVFSCTYAEGKVELIRKDLVGEAAISGLDVNASLPQNTLLCTGEKSLTEITGDSFLIRLGAMTVLESVTDESLKLFSGSMLIHLPVDSTITLQSEKTEVFIKGKLTAIVECTSNGGFKFIPLEGKGSIVPQQGEAKNIRSGRMTMVVGDPSRLGNAYDIDLLLMLKSSRLINSFPEPLPSMKKVSLAIYYQQLRLKGKFNALIGDAPSDDNLQMWTFGKGAK
jgi:hypothetical protein